MLMFVRSMAILACWSLVFVAIPVAPAKAGDADRIIRGIGGLIILNEMSKRSKKKSKGTRSGRSSSKKATKRAAGPQYTRAEKQQIQSFLNQMGFDAGVVDGSFGRQTANAISRFQGENGYKRTGSLSKKQFAVLAAIAGGGTVLAGTGSAAEERDLTPQEVRLMQQSLKSLGYYSSTIDGVAGRGTGRAVSGFLQSKGLDPSNVSALDALRMASAEAGVALPTYLTTRNTTARAQVNSAEYRPLFFRSKESADLTQTLWLNAIRTYPAILDDEAFMKAETGGFRDVFNMAPEGFGRMNQLERENATDALRETLRRKAEAAPAISAQQPLKVAFYTPAGISEFVEGKGLLLRSGELTSLLKSVKRRDATYGIEYTFSEPATRGLIGIEKSAAEALWAKVEAGNDQRPRKKPYIVSYVTITDVGMKKVSARDEVEGKGSDTVEFTFRVDAVEYHLTEQGEYAPRATSTEAPLYRWPLKGDVGVAQPSAGLAGWAARVGYKMTAGHLPTHLSGGNLSKLMLRLKLGLNPDWAREGNRFESIGVALMPRDEAVDFFGPEARYTSISEMELYDGASRFFKNEFDRRLAKEKFFNERYDALRQVSAPWPLPYVHSIPVQVSEYDFEEELFVLSYRVPTYQNTNYEQMTPDQIQAVTRIKPPVFIGKQFDSKNAWSGDRSLHNLPIVYPTNFDDARVISDRLAKNNRTAYLGVFYSVDAPERLTDPEKMVGLVSRSEPTRVALFFDKALTQVMLEFDLEAHLKPKGGTTAAPAVTAGAKPKAVVYENEAQAFLAAANRYSAQDVWRWSYQNTPKLQQRILDTSKKVRRANEFQIKKARTSELEALTQPVAPEGWLSLTVVFGKYDFGTGTMAVQALGVGVPDDDKGGFYGEARPQMDMDAFGTSLKLDPAVAERIAGFRDRKVIGLVRGRFMEGEMILPGDKGRYSYFEPKFDPIEVVLFGRPGNTPNSFLFRTVLNEELDAAGSVVADADVSEVSVESDFDILGLRLGAALEDNLTALADKREITAHYEAEADGRRFVVFETGPDEAFTLVLPADVDKVSTISRFVSRPVTGFGAERIAAGLGKKYGDAVAGQLDDAQGAMWIENVGAQTCDPVESAAPDAEMPALTRVSGLGRDGVSDLAQSTLRRAMLRDMSIPTEAACNARLSAELLSPLGGRFTLLATVLTAPQFRHQMLGGGAAEQETADIDF